MKALDANRYATKKTIAQGMLDIALLTANASQLKYILQVGPKHEFYKLMLTLVTISISLQVSAGLFVKRPSISIPITLALTPHHLISLSIIIIIPLLQIGLGALDLTGTLLRDCKLHLTEYHASAKLLNSISTALALLVTVLNLLITALEPYAGLVISDIQ